MDEIFFIWEGRFRCEGYSFQFEQSDLPFFLWFTCLYLCLLIHISIHIYDWWLICLYICLMIHISMDIYVWWFIYLYIYVWWFIYLYICFLIHISVYIYVWWFIYLHTSMFSDSYVYVYFDSQCRQNSVHLLHQMSHVHATTMSCGVNVPTKNTKNGKEMVSLYSYLQYCKTFTRSWLCTRTSGIYAWWTLTLLLTLWGLGSWNCIS